MSDELSVSERELKPPEAPPALTVSAIMRGEIYCDKHHNRYSSARMEFTATPGSNGTRARGEVHLRFSGCTCRYWRPLK